ncbi:iron permease FTR1 [Rhodopseudomonas palustris BisB5]|uniref:Iron permease FTR1 n=1 Tax=Rhodopseudomonas palustris (strain BisB5) TaxID=316057 RepID=Q132X9_RHOPS|nr:iron permease FTR1 [Rhodopseudomonas palustris BisB5]
MSTPCTSARIRPADSAARTILHLSFSRMLGLALVLMASTVFATPSSAQSTAPQTIWRLLDYVAVDYPEAVQDGKIVSQTEYDEMKEFSATASKLIGDLPETPDKTDLKAKAAALEQHIASKAAPTEIAVAARNLGVDLVKAYPIPLSPAAAPDLARGQALYAQHCGACHGADGRGDGAQAAGLEPPPIAFTDEARARERSVLALYQVIEQGIDGTSMASFADLPAADRWALAFFVGTLAYPADMATEGKTIWDSESTLRTRFDLQNLVGLRPAVLASQIGDEKARQLVAYLRRHPEATKSAVPAAVSLTLARTRLDEAMAAYRKGERRSATDLALSAYLDGFEPVEAILSARDKPLMIRIESAMGDLRSAIARSDPADAVAGRVAALDGLFANAEAVLSAGDASPTSSFLASFTILVREGLEAILIVTAMLSFLAKADRRDVLPYVHGGWIAALVAGAGTWAAATWLISISGASRELTEGFGGVFAALVLLWVGIWMHGKSHADTWQRYIRERLGSALNRRSAWFLFALAFIVVYREVFETILFYAAIWGQGNSGAVVGGGAAATVVLAFIAFVILRYSRTLPIGKFFAYSSGLIAVLAVVLMGKGSAALQEAGYLPVTPWAGFPRNELLGFYPTMETISAQLAIVVLLAFGFLHNRRSKSAER